MKNIFSKRKKADAPKKKLIRSNTLVGAYVSPRSGYTFTPSFIKAGNRYGSIVKIVNLYGSNRDGDYGWAVNLIPQASVPGVKITMISVDKAITADEQQTVMDENVRGNTTAETEDSNHRKDQSGGEKQVSKMRLIDLNLASVLDAQNGKIIDDKLRLLFVSDNPQLIVRQIERSQQVYDDTMPGIKLISVAGSQEQLLTSLSEPPESSEYDYTWMSHDFAGNNYITRKGLNDIGWPVGSMSASYSSGESFFSLDKSFKSQILVSAHNASAIRGYDEKISASSLWGQLVANNAMAHGHRTYHLVLNSFKYYASKNLDGTFLLPYNSRTLLQQIDTSQGNLNPIEGFGQFADTPDIYDHLLQKNKKIIYLLSGRSLDGATQIILQKELNQFYINKLLWHPEEPQRSRITGIEDHSTIPTYGALLLELNNLLSEVKREDDQTELTQAKTLNNSLESMLGSAAAKMFNQTTKLPLTLDTSYYQYYFNFHSLNTNSDVMEAQFINYFDYISNQVKPGDIVMIHGMDQLSIETIDLLEKQIKALTEKKVRMAYLFDAIGSGAKKSKIPRADIFNIDGRLYQDLDHDFDYAIYSSMSDQELDMYLQKVRQEMTPSLRKTLTVDDKNLFRIRRPLDSTSSMVIGDFIV